MALDVAADERAERQHLEPARAQVVERPGDERRADALALERVEDLRVVERDPLAAPVVGGEAGELAVRRGSRSAARPGCRRPRGAWPNRAYVAPATTIGVSTEVALLCVLAVVAALLIVAQWARIPYPILLVLGGLGLAVIPGHPRRDPRAGAGAADHPPPAALRGRVLHAAARAAAQRRPDLAARRRARARDHGRGRGRRPRGARLRLGAGVRARRDRLPHRPGRGDRDRAPARRRRPGSSRWSRARA